MKLQPFKKTFLLILSFLLIFISANAQLASKVPVEVKLKSFTFNKLGSFFGDLLGNKVTPVYKFYLDSVADSHGLNNNLCYSVSVKDKAQIYQLSENNTFGGPLVMTTQVDLNAGKDFVLLMENYLNEKGNICEFKKGDTKHKISRYGISLASLKHGVTQQPITINAEQNQYSATLTIRLGLPVPVPPGFEISGKYLDGTKTITFKSNMNVLNKDGLLEEWQGSLDGNHWFSMGEKSSKEELTITPEKDILKAILQVTSKCYLRYRIISPELTSEWAEKAFEIVPPAPVVKKDDLFTTPSCFAASSGKITIKSIKGQTKKYRIIVIGGKDRKDTACFEDLNNTCPESVKDTIITTSSVVLDNMAPGDYTVLVGNANIKSDFFSSNTVKIDQFSRLEITGYNSNPDNCANSPAGSIQIETKGGNPDSLTFLITPVSGELVKKGRNGSFQKLPEGKYNVLVKDACDQVLSTPLIPVSSKDDTLKAVISILKKPDFDKNNGSVRVKIENGSGFYFYKLFLQDNLMQSKEFSAMEHNIESLYGAKYKILITDKNAPKCTGWNTEFNLEQNVIPALTPVAADSTKPINN